MTSFMELMYIIYISHPVCHIKGREFHEMYHFLAFILWTGVVQML